MASRVTQILAELRAGDVDARTRLLDAVYEELRRIAASNLRHERPGHTLQPTALAHEAYVALLGERKGNFEDRAHFLSAAAKVMRSILIDFARARRAQKRGGGRVRITWRADLMGNWSPGPDEILAVHEALETLEAIDPRRSQIVELRFFAGMTMKETAAVMGVSERTAYGLWEHARAWLFRELDDGE